MKRIAAILSVAVLCSYATAQTNSAIMPQPSVSVNTNNIVRFITFLPNYSNVQSFDDFLKSSSSNSTFAAVYSWSTKGGLSSGGAAVGLSMLDLTWQVDSKPWSIHVGPMVVLGSDKVGVFSAIEAAEWSDQFAPIVAKLKSVSTFFNIIPDSVGHFYEVFGAGVETFGNSGMGHSFIMSAGVGVKF